ncbi:hypothetical protein BDY19DRAFT_942554 [Irpex rosettiformis]|uniref:Uncharacterized protein n=1 Tax=Irpex rosettiformis TaxID=378272 RepID=A0ACB8U5P1_9APHY|nr:hypothetical protein BDY19DRAFT_942554 [Irpex rosettiformis]
MPSWLWTLGFLLLVSPGTFFASRSCDSHFTGRAEHPSGKLTCTLKPTLITTFSDFVVICLEQRDFQHAFSRRWM